MNKTNKALLTVLVVTVVAGVFVRQSDALLRAGREKIAEKSERGADPYEKYFKTKVYQPPVYFRQGRINIPDYC